MRSFRPTRSISILKIAVRTRPPRSHARSSNHTRIYIMETTAKFKKLECSLDHLVYVICRRMQEHFFSR
jgi:hypothetical protein